VVHHHGLRCRDVLGVALLLLLSERCLGVRRSGTAQGSPGVGRIPEGTQPDRIPRFRWDAGSKSVSVAVPSAQERLRTFGPEPPSVPWPRSSVRSEDTAMSPMREQRIFGSWAALVPDAWWVQCAADSTKLTRMSRRRLSGEAMKLKAFLCGAGLADPENVRVGTPLYNKFWEIVLLAWRSNGEDPSPEGPEGRATGATRTLGHALFLEWAHSCELLADKKAVCYAVYSLPEVSHFLMREKIMQPVERLVLANVSGHEHGTRSCVSPLARSLNSYERLREAREQKHGCSFVEFQARYEKLREAIQRRPTDAECRQAKWVALEAVLKSTKQERPGNCSGFSSEDNHAVEDSAQGA